VLPASWSPDGRYLATSIRQGANQPPKCTVKVWDAATGASVATWKEQHADWITQLSWSADSKRLVSASYDRTAKVWDLGPNGGVRTLDGHRGDLTGNTLFGPSSYFSDWWKSGTGFSFEEAAVAWSPDGGQVASVLPYRATFGQPDAQVQTGPVRIWDPNTGTTLQLLKAPSLPVRVLAWSPDGRQLAALASRGGTQARPQEVTIWDLTTGQMVTHFVLESATGAESVSDKSHLVFSPDNQRLTVGSKGRMCIWDAKTGKELQALPDSVIGPVAWHPDGRRLATLAKGDHQHAVIRIWDTTTGTALQTVRGPSGGVKALLWSRDGKRLFLGSPHNTITVYDPETNTDLLTLRGSSTSLLWSLDGHQLLSNGETGPTIWRGHP
jgi:WD40 repeat protein